MEIKHFDDAGNTRAVVGDENECHYVVNFLHDAIEGAVMVICVVVDGGESILYNASIFYSNWSPSSVQHIFRNM